MAGVKGMKFKKKRREPRAISDGRICEYGCKQPANYEFRTGKVSCAKHGGNCPAKRSIAKEKFKEYAYSVNPESGLTRATEMALAAAETLRNQIDAETGLSRNITVRRKITKNSIESGNRQRVIARMVEEKRNIIDPATGLNMHQTNAIKGRDTRLSDVDEHGRNSYDRMWQKWHPQAKNHLKTGLYYQSLNEKEFLDSLSESQSKTVRRGPPISYTDPNDGMERIYLPDFIIDGVIYEIKSSYSWYEWKGIPQRDKNIAKLNAVIANGFQAVVVIDGARHNWPANL